MQTVSFTWPFWVRKCMSFYNLVILNLLCHFKIWDYFGSWWRVSFKTIFISHRCNTGGTPFPLCPIGCSSNCPLGKRRLGEQPHYFSSSGITCRYILFTAQKLLRKVQADANCGFVAGSSESLWSLPQILCTLEADQHSFFYGKILVTVVKLYIFLWKGLSCGALT